MAQVIATHRLTGGFKINFLFHCLTQKKLTLHPSRKCMVFFAIVSSIFQCSGLLVDCYVQRRNAECHISQVPTMQA